MDRRNGFTLVEVVVALVVFATALLGIIAMQALAVRTLGRATHREAAVLIAGNVADSLVQAPAPEPGGREVGRHRVRWTTEPRGRGTLIEVRVRYPTVAGVDTVRLRAFHTATPRVLEPDA